MPGRVRHVDHGECGDERVPGARVTPGVIDAGFRLCYVRQNSNRQTCRNLRLPNTTLSSAVPGLVVSVRAYDGPARCTWAAGVAEVTPARP